MPGWKVFADFTAREVRLETTVVGLGRLFLQLNNPAELVGLIFREVPGIPDKFKTTHWGAMIILRRNFARQKPRRMGHAIVGHDIACGRDPHDNVVVLDFDYIASRQHFIPRRIRLLQSSASESGDSIKPRGARN